MEIYAITDCLETSFIEILQNIRRHATEKTGESVPATLHMLSGTPGGSGHAQWQEACRMAGACGITPVRHARAWDILHDIPYAPEHTLFLLDVDTMQSSYLSQAGQGRFDSVQMAKAIESRPHALLADSAHKIYHEDWLDAYMQEYPGSPRPVLTCREDLHPEFFKEETMARLITCTASPIIVSSFDCSTAAENRTRTVYTIDAMGLSSPSGSYTYVMDNPDGTPAYDAEGNTFGNFSMSHIDTDMVTTRYCRQ